MLKEGSAPKVKAHSCVTARPWPGLGPPSMVAEASPVRVEMARTEVLCLLPRGGDLGWLHAAADRTRLVLPGAESGDDRGIRDFVDRGGEVRFGDQVSMHMVVVDRELALVPGRSHSSAERGTVTRNPAVVSRLVAVFEAHWSQAREPEGARPMPDQRHEVLALLASGMTDETVARKLEISTRTVQRHVQRAMTELNARSRFELGVHLTRRGLL